MHAVITGAGGLLGTELVRVFRASGHDVLATDLASADLSAHTAVGAEAGVCDVTDRDSVRAAVQGADVVVHAAGIFDLSADPALLQRVNVDAVPVVCRGAAEAGVKRVVHVSSTGVYGRCGLDTSERTEPEPVMAYERSKWAGERAAVDTCAELGLRCAVLRPTLLYGPGSRYGLAPTLALLALRSHWDLRALPVARGGPVGHLVHVEDVARAAELLATASDAEGAYNIADDTPVKAGDLLRIMADSVGAKVADLAPPWFLVGAYPAVRPLIRRALPGLNAKIARAWTSLVRREGLVDALRPRLELDFVDYFVGGHSYDTSKLAALGFTCAHPDARGQIEQTVAWYRGQKWLPAG